MATGYLTPESAPAGLTCRALFIPDDEQFIANVRGLLQTFTFPQSFVKQGALTPEQTAAAYVEMFDRFCFNAGPCKMIGEVVVFAGAINPKPGIWLPCDGASLLRADYPALFVVIGTTYGAVDGTHFTLPDTRGRAIVGEGHGTGLTNRALGDEFGNEEITLTTADMPSHTHSDTGHNHSEITAVPSVTSISPGVPEPTAIPGLGATGTGFANITSSGGDGAHSNLQPSLALGVYIVALDG